ncbi:unnamed protein product [Closterium sp. NIES-54]
MASLNVLTFDHEGHLIQFDTWLDGLQLYLLSDSRDSVSLFHHTSGASLAPPATADSATRSQWLTRDAAACLAFRNHLPLAERPHFGQHKTAKALYDDVVARPPPIPGTHIMALRPSSVPLRVPLPSPPASSLPDVPDPESDFARAASPTVPRPLATIVTDPSFESAAVSTLVAELVGFAAACCLDYATSLVAESESDYPPSVGGECALGTDVLEGTQEDFECLAATLPHVVAMLLAPEGDPDAPDIPTPRSYPEAITVPPSGANIVVGMWIFMVKRPPGSPPVFKAPRKWNDTLRTTLAALGFAPSTADLSLFLRTNTSLPPFYVLVYVDDLVFATTDTEALALVKSELQKRHTCIDLGELRSYLGLQITRDRAQCTITLTQSHMVHQVLQRFVFRYSSPQSNPLPTGHSLSAPPSDESVEPSGPYPELVGCLMNLMACTRPDLPYPLSILACYVAPGRHRPEHQETPTRALGGR